MGRVTSEARLQERSARARLKVRHNPYWRMISEGRHLGYYRGSRAGTWVARYRVAGASDNGVKASLGFADDFAEANGDAILNWKQALDRANAWFDLQASGGTKIDPNITVLDALTAFIAMRDARETARVGRPARSTASSKLGCHVLPDKILVAVKLRDLTEADLRAWQRRLPNMKGSSKQRVVTELKAALNDTVAENRRALPPDLALTIKFGLKSIFSEETATESVARENQILEDRQVRLILAKAHELDEDGDYSLLAILLAATGARFSQLARMMVRDVQVLHKRVLVPPSRKGRGKKAGAYIRIQVGPDVMEALGPAIEGRSPTAPLLERWHYRQVTKIEWVRADRQAWKTPSEMLRWWKKVVEGAGLPHVIPYALRHSSIVRAIGAGVPIRLVAALHDTSVAMIEKHYSRWITESLDDLSARAIIPLLRAA